MLAAVGGVAAAVDGGRPAAARLRRQGGGVHRPPGRRPARPPPPPWNWASSSWVPALTVAYTLRFWWGAFARKPGLPDPAPAELVHRPGALFLAAPAALALAGLALGPASPLLGPLVAAYAETLPLLAPEAETLALWHGWQPALLLSAISVLGGAALFVARTKVNRLQRRFAVGASADEGYWNTIQFLDRLSVLVTGTTQRGSLPAYLGTILVVVLALPGTILLTRAPWPDEWRAWDTPVQALIGVVILIAAGMALRIRQRLSVVLVVGVTGYGAAVLFALQGAPDLALTQFLVETLTLVTFVLVLRKLPKDITERHLPRERAVRGVLAVAMGLLMAGVGAVALDVRTATPVSAAYPEEAYDFGGGKNIVNVILVDIRAWDTLGEISLLVVAATGVASLVFLRRRTGGVDRLDGAEPGRDPVARGPGTAPPLARRQRDAAARAPLRGARGDHPGPLPHDPGVLALPAVLRPQRARRRVRRRAGRGARAGPALSRRRSLRAGGGGAGRPGAAARRRAAASPAAPGWPACCWGPRCCRRRSSRPRCPSSAT